MQSSYQKTMQIIRNAFCVCMCYFCFLLFFYNEVFSPTNLLVSHRRRLHRKHISEEEKETKRTENKPCVTWIFPLIKTIALHILSKSCDKQQNSTKEKSEKMRVVLTSQ